MRHFSTVDELRAALLVFEETYNREWLIARLGYARRRRCVRRLPSGPGPDYDQLAVQLLCPGTGTIRVKLGAGDTGSALLLLDQETEPAVQLRAGSTTTSITLKGRDGKQRVITPQDRN